MGGYYGKLKYDRKVLAPRPYQHVNTGRTFQSIVDARKYAIEYHFTHNPRDSYMVEYIDLMVKCWQATGMFGGWGAVGYGWVKTLEIDGKLNLVWRAPNKKDSRIINVKGEVIGKIPTKYMALL